MSGSGQTEAEERFTVVGLERQGLEGFLTVRQLRAAKLTEVPKSPGVYVVLRPPLHGSMRAST